MRLKQVIEELRSLAQRHAAWTAVVDYALAEYQRIRGDHAHALEYIDTALKQLAAGTHQIWPHAAASQLRALCAQERFDDAVRIGQSNLQAAIGAELGHSANYIRMPLATAYARLGQHARARELAHEALRVFDDLGTSGVNLVLVYETCSHVAWHTGNLEEYKYFALLCAEACRDMNAQALRARSERLLRTASAPGHVTPEAVASLMTETTLLSAFRACNEPEERAERTLELLLSHSGAPTGVLYLAGEHGPMLAAQIGPDPSPELTANVLEMVDTEVRQRDLVTASIVPAISASKLSTVVAEHALVLLCHQTSDGIAITGVAALAVSPGLCFIHPGALAARLSRMLVEAGDVLPLGTDG